jgi:hypothetical protein
MTRKKGNSERNKSKTRTRELRPTTPCTIPEPLDPAVLNAFAPQAKNEREAIKNYVEWQSPKEKVTYVERVLTERILDQFVWFPHESKEVRRTGVQPGHWTLARATVL